MGFLDPFNFQPTTPTVPSVLPEAARQQILRGQLPTLEPSNLFLKQGEICHYVDRAIYEKRTVNKKRICKNAGYSMPGLFKGTRVHIGRGNSEYVDNVKYLTIKGILYITTKRIIFVGGADGFERKIDTLVAMKPYTNCIELQFSKDTMKLFVPDGRLLHIVLKLI